MIDKFIQQFTDKKIENITKIRNQYFLTNKEIIELKDKIKQEPYSIGIYLGEETSKGFEPSPALIEEIAKHSEKKIFINEKASYLFICGRDIFGKSIIKANANSGIVLVQNEKDENLGYGRIVVPLTEKNKIAVKNILDKGQYLRQEMTK